ncbi:unnamed protein product, partial [Ectocarpus sp. 8 AP-2014]
YDTTRSGKTPSPHLCFPSSSIPFIYLQPHRHESSRRSARQRPPQHITTTRNKMYTKGLSYLALLLIPGACHGLIETCDDLLAAFEQTQTEDVVVEMHPFADIECDTFTNMTMTSNTLTVSSSENVDNFFGSSNLVNVRLDVTNGA